nr:MAG TPA: hypothetical protein [Bacteriophage sp.]
MQIARIRTTLQRISSNTKRIRLDGLPQSR